MSVSTILEVRRRPMFRIWLLASLVWIGFVVWRYWQMYGFWSAMIDYLRIHCTGCSFPEHTGLEDFVDSLRMVAIALGPPAFALLAGIATIRSAELLRARKITP